MGLDVPPVVLCIGPVVRRAIWRDSFSSPKSPMERALRFGLVVGVHAVVIVGGIGVATEPEVREAARELVVRLIDPAPIIPEAESPRPQPVRSNAAPRPTPPLPVLAVPADTSATSSFVVPSQPAVAAHSDASAREPASPELAAARFDADYLHNPKPVYPTFSRRRGEEGSVLLRVRVGAGGTALDVEVAKPSGFPRLDAAAREAVGNWRFIPAKRGSEAIESWVAVPIVFSLHEG